MKALVTGATGFAGTHLVDLLAASQGGPVDGTTFEDPALGSRDAVRLHPCDVTKPAEIAPLLERLRPTHLFHLAAPSHVGESFERPLEAVQGVISGAVAVLAAAVRLEPRPRVLMVGSAEVYGNAPGVDRPFTEDFALDPDSPYGVGKLAAEAFARFEARRGLPVVIVRPFNHIGPGQSDRFVCSAFARQIAEAEAGLRPPVVEVGNLKPERDFTDVRDTVRAYALLLERGQPGEVYNIASGRAVAISELLDRLVALSTVKIEVRRDPARERPADVPRRVGDAQKLRALGWEPTIPLEQTLRDALDDWRRKLRAVR